MAPQWPRDRPVRMKAGGRLDCGLCAGRSRLIGGAGFWPHSINAGVVFTLFTCTNNNYSTFVEYERHSAYLQVIRLFFFPPVVSVIRGRCIVDNLPPPCRPVIHSHSYGHLTSVLPPPVWSPLFLFPGLSSLCVLLPSSSQVIIANYI